MLGSGLRTYKSTLVHYFAALLSSSKWGLPTVLMEEHITQSDIVQRPGYRRLGIVKALPLQSIYERGVVFLRVPFSRLVELITCD